MSIIVNQRSYVGVSNLIMKRISDGVVLSWPQPQTFVLDTGIEQRLTEGRNQQGRKVRTGSYAVGEMPTLSINYTYIQPELISFTVGNQFASGTFSSFLPKSLAVTQATYAGDAAGKLFNGVLETEAAAALNGAVASITRNDLSVNLTYEDFTSFTGTTDDTFSVGDDGALKFSNNLVTEQALVTMLIPHNNLTGIKLSDVLVGAHELYATVVDSNNKVSLFEARNVTPNLEGRSVDFGSEGLELNLFVNNLPGTCGSWSMLALDATVDCL